MTGRADPFADAKAVADAVLYEGYVLYPYRASARKNQVRWQFGVLMPRAFSESDGSERWSTRTECLLDPGLLDSGRFGSGPLDSGSTPTLRVRVRCLQIQHRGVDAVVDGQFVPAGVLEIGGTTHVDWDEAVEAVVDLGPVTLPGLLAAELTHPFRLEPGTDYEELRGLDGEVAGRLVRRRRPVDGEVLVAAEPAGGLVKLSVTVRNVTPWTTADGTTRDDALSRSLVAVHTMLAVEAGHFVSLLDPPADTAEAAAGCRSEGSYPVLIGDADDVVLSSPIILYDHPGVAPESPGDLYDSTEIDEILALRVMTLTDEEKAEARGTDRRAAAIIDRCDDMPPELWERLHGAIRTIHPAADRGAADEVAVDSKGFGAVGAGLEAASVDGGVDPVTAAVPWWDPGADASVDPSTDSVMIAGVDVRRGTQVRLRPSRRSDAQDLFLDGRPATVAAIFRDVEDNDYVAVTLDDDPAAGEMEWQGRYRYFYPDELELTP